MFCFVVLTYTAMCACSALAAIVAVTLRLLQPLALHAMLLTSVQLQRRELSALMPFAGAEHLRKLKGIRVLSSCGCADVNSTGMTAVAVSMDCSSILGPTLA